MTFSRTPDFLIFAPLCSDTHSLGHEFEDVSSEMHGFKGGQGLEFRPTIDEKKRYRKPNTIFDWCVMDFVSILAPFWHPKAIRKTIEHQCEKKTPTTLFWESASLVSGSTWGAPSPRTPLPLYINIICNVQRVEALPVIRRT